MYFPLQWFLATVITLIAPSLQATAFVLLTSFIVSSANGTSIQTKHFQLSFLNPGQPSTVFVVAILCGGLLVASSLARFVGDKLFIGLRFSYTNFSVRRGILEISKRWEEINREGTVKPRAIASILRKDSIFCGRIAMLAASIASPLAEFTIAILIAFWLYPLLTIAIGLTALLAGRFLRQISVEGSHYSIIREKYGSEAGQEIEGLLLESQTSKDSDHPLELNKNSLARTQQWLDSLLGFIFVVPLSRLTSGVLTGIVTSIIVIGLGTQIIAETNTLSGGLVYLIALRYMVKSFQQIIKYLSSLNRFYTQAERYHNLLQGKLPATFSTDSSEEDDDDFDD